MAAIKWQYYLSYERIFIDKKRLKGEDFSVTESLGKIRMRELSLSLEVLGHPLKR